MDTLYNKYSYYKNRYKESEVKYRNDLNSISLTENNQILYLIYNCNMELNKIKYKDNKYTKGDIREFNVYDLFDECIPYTFREIGLVNIDNILPKEILENKSIVVISDGKGNGRYQLVDTLDLYVKALDNARKQGIDYMDLYNKFIGKSFYIEFYAKKDGNEYNLEYDIESNELQVVTMRMSNLTENEKQTVNNLFNNKTYDGVRKKTSNKNKKYEEKEL